MAAANTTMRTPGQQPMDQPNAGQLDIGLYKLRTKVDILVKVAEDHLDDPCDVLTLVKTNKELSIRLDHEIYRTDALQAREKVRLALPKAIPELDDDLKITTLLKLSVISLSVPGNHDQNVNQILNSIFGFTSAVWRRFFVFSQFPSVTEPTILHIAARANNRNMARKALRFGMPCWPGYIDAKYRDRTALMICVLKSDRAACFVDLLLEHGCFVDTWLPEYVKPLGGKVFRRRTNKDGYLFVNGMVISHELIDKKKTKNLYINPLGAAIASGNEHMAQKLAAHTRDDGRFPPWPASAVFVRPLQLAALAGMGQVIGELLRRGHSARARNSLFPDRTALDLAVKTPGRNDAIVRLLVPDLDARERRTTAFPWYEAVLQHKPESAICLLEAQAAPRDPDRLRVAAALCVGHRPWDEMLPVLRWIVEREYSRGVRLAVQEAAHRLIIGKQGTPPDTFRYLLAKHILHPMFGDLEEGAKNPMLEKYEEQDEKTKKYWDDVLAYDCAELAVKPQEPFVW